MHANIASHEETRCSWGEGGSGIGHFSHVLRKKGTNGSLTKLISSSPQFFFSWGGGKETHSGCCLHDVLPIQRRPGVPISMRTISFEFNCGIFA